MNEIITNGSEIKERISGEISRASRNIRLAMAWFTDRDIASALIEAHQRGVHVDVVLSSNIQNDTVKAMLASAGITVHAFETGDPRGIMHHKFCLLDDRISINGSYNYSYNASSNNVENIHISADLDVFRQLLAEFDRIKYNIDHDIDVNQTPPKVVKNIADNSTPGTIEAFSQQLHNLVYSAVQISTDDYRMRGYELAKKSNGNLDLFRNEHNTIIEELNAFATDDGLTSKKNTLSSNVDHAFQGAIERIEEEKQRELKIAGRENELAVQNLETRLAQKNNEWALLERGNPETGEHGLLQLNKEIGELEHERLEVETSLPVTRFWSISTVLVIALTSIFAFYLSVFFASAVYKVLFEETHILEKMDKGQTPESPQIIDADAIVNIFVEKGVLFGLIATFFFLIPLLLSNLKLLGSKIKWVNHMMFIIGLIIFDIIVAMVVMLNIDKIESLLKGRDSKMGFLDTFSEPKFWMIFAFGMFPLLITHFLLNYLVDAYRSSKREIVDAATTRKLSLLNRRLLHLTSDRNYLNERITVLKADIESIKNDIRDLQTAFHQKSVTIEQQFLKRKEKCRTIFNDFKSKITSGKIFTEVILNSAISAYKIGFIEYLPHYYSETEVGNRVAEIERRLN